jgi:putative DNA primase/helicase
MASEIANAPTTPNVPATTLSAGEEVHDNRFTEEGNANRFVRIHGSDVRYCHHQNTWYVWDGNRWKDDRIQHITDIARAVVVELYEEAEELFASDTTPTGIKIAERAKKFAKSADTLRGLTNMVRLSSSVPQLAVDVAELDSQPMLFNAIGTTIALYNNVPQAMEPQRSHMITKIGGCEFDPAATCPNWNKFVREIFNGDEELMMFVHKAVGYSLAGPVTEKCFFFCYGDGSNGKTVFLNIIRAVFGDYGQQASIKTFLKKRNESEIRDDLVNLKGARFVTAVEPDDNSRFDMEVMKPLTGNDPIRCRTLHQRQIEFLPEVKLWIAGNNKPVITETNTGTWDRVRLIPFTVSFIGREDRGLEAKLRCELPGILNWILEGYTMYKNDRLITPSSVEAATQDYKVECNSLLSYITQHCVRVKPNEGEVRTSIVYERYKAFCEEEGLFAYGNRRAKTVMRSQGIEVRHSKSGDFYVGLLLNESLPVQKGLPTESNSLQSSGQETTPK